MLCRVSIVLNCRGFCYTEAQLMVQLLLAPLGGNVSRYMQLKATNAEDPLDVCRHLWNLKNLQLDSDKSEYSLRWLLLSAP